MKNNYDSMLEERDDLYEQRKVVVLGCGCFDVIHFGHIEYLRAAKALGDFLIIGINTDSSYRKLRGYPPYFTQEQRRTVIDGIRYVDRSFLFDDINVNAALLAIKPDIFAVGVDKVNVCMDEMTVCKVLNIPLKCVGTKKLASSSEIKSFYAQNASIAKCI